MRDTPIVRNVPRSKEYIVEYIKQQIVMAGSQKKFAAMMGVSPQYINDIIRDRRDISEGIAKKLGFIKEIRYRDVR